MRAKAGGTNKFVRLIPITNVFLFDQAEGCVPIRETNKDTTKVQILMREPIGAVSSRRRSIHVVKQLLELVESSCVHVQYVYNTPYSPYTQQSVYGIYIYKLALPRS